MIRSRHSSRRDNGLNVPGKANRILNIILVGLLLIVLRVWHLSIIEHDVKLQAAQAPTRRVVIEPARRATIRDRFGLPLAINKIQYNAAVSYSQILNITSRKQRREHIRKLSELLATELNLNADELEDRIHAEAAFYDHTSYIIKKDISEQEYYRLKMREATWVGLQAERVPKRYYPYNKVGADVVGYMGAIDADTYQALIQERKALQTFLRQHDAGQDPDLPDGFVSTEQVRARLREIEERSYAINDYIGKSGIEAQFEEDLRGYHGKKRYFVDSKGNYLRELPGPRKPIPGRSIVLTLSAQLQEYAEQLLTQDEDLRTTRVAKPDRNDENEPPAKSPWIKGGAIVALNPNNGEVIALASYPRFDPNDFVTSGDPSVDKARRANVRRWFETDSYIGEMWDGKRPLSREHFDHRKGFYEEEVPLSWERYLDLSLFEKGDVMKGMQGIVDIEGAIVLQNAVNKLVAAAGHADLAYLFNLLYQEEGHQPQKSPLPAAERERIEGNLNVAAEEIEFIKLQMDPYLTGVKHTYDKVLLVDLCRVAVDGDRFSSNLLAKVGDQPISVYRRLNQATINVQEAVHQMSRDLFHGVTFKEWRKGNEKAFLKQKRREETLASRYAKPYTELLDAKENELFQSFWQEHGPDLVLLFLRGRLSDRIEPQLAPFQQYFESWQREIAHGAHSALPWIGDYLILQDGLAHLDDSSAKSFVETMRSYKELNRPLFGRYRQLRWEKGQQLERSLAAAFYPTYGFGYGRSLAFRQATPQGSIFKIVTAYEALVQRYIALKACGQDLSKLNPLRIIDQPVKTGKNWIVGYTMTGQPIPQFYKGGLLPKTLTRNIGEIDLARAIEVSSNSYFALLTSDLMANPDDLAYAAHSLSYGARTGIQLPGEITGRVPTDLAYNRDGLYMLAIGQHSLVVTPLQTAVMLATLANGGQVFQPKIVSNIIGTAQPRNFCLSTRRGLDYRDSLLAAGIDFPFFVASAQRIRESRTETPPSIVERHVMVPSLIRSMLFEGMYRVAYRYQTKTLSSLRELYGKCPGMIESVVELTGQMIGKTSTAESMENFGPDRQVGTRTYNHVWFGSVAFDKGSTHEMLFKDEFGRPELVVIVYLRYGAVGRNALPLATSVAAKWRELKRQAERS